MARRSTRRGHDGRGQRIAVDLAGLGPAEQRVGGDDHGQPGLHRRQPALPGPQDQIGQAVGHPLIPGPRTAVA
ncbi:MAG TPA: hypothetical protein VHF92_15620, partial [Geodermatophilus sp.]|nr:hypothetical protein [Geodermatophilus sp.]